MICYVKTSLRFCEYWYIESAPEPGTDIAIYVQLPAAGSGRGYREKHTLLLKLDEDAEQLFANIKKDSRTEIRRAAKDGVQCEALSRTDTACIDWFLDYYGDFASSKGLATPSSAWMKALFSRGLLEISMARDTHGQVLACHLYLCYSSRARLLYSPSSLHIFNDNAKRNAIGRANRLLHWEDIRRFQQLGFEK